MMRTALSALLAAATGASDIDTAVVSTFLEADAGVSFMVPPKEPAAKKKTPKEDAPIGSAKAGAAGGKGGGKVGKDEDKGQGGGLGKGGDKGNDGDQDKGGDKHKGGDKGKGGGKGKGGDPGKGGSKGKGRDHGKGGSKGMNIAARLQANQKEFARKWVMRVKSQKNELEIQYWDLEQKARSWASANDRIEVVGGIVVELKKLFGSDPIGKVPQRVAGLNENELKEPKWQGEEHLAKVMREDLEKVEKDKKDGKLSESDLSLYSQQVKQMTWTPVAEVDLYKNPIEAIVVRLETFTSIGRKSLAEYEALVAEWQKASQDAKGGFNCVANLGSWLRNPVAQCVGVSGVCCAAPICVMGWEPVKRRMMGLFGYEKEVIDDDADVSKRVSLRVSLRDDEDRDEEDGGKNGATEFLGKDEDAAQKGGAHGGKQKDGGSCCA